MSDLLEKIKQRGYWKVIIRPTEFKEDRIASKDECVKLIESCQIRLRGWYYPHIENREIQFTGNDSVGSECWTGQKIEYWRFYQNGQFIHYFGMDEDYRLPPEKVEEIRRSLQMKDTDNPDNKFLSILGLLYDVTEIFLFAACLAKRANLGPEIYIELELADVKERTLFFWNSFDRVWWEAYMCRFASGNILKKYIVPADELITNVANLALDAAIEIFKDFGWRDVNKNIFAEDQRKLLERRL